MGRKKVSGANQIVFHAHRKLKDFFSLSRGHKTVSIPHEKLYQVDSGDETSGSSEFNTTWV